MMKGRRHVKGRKMDDEVVLTFFSSKRYDHEEKRKAFSLLQGTPSEVLFGGLVLRRAEG